MVPSNTSRQRSMAITPLNRQILSHSVMTVVSLIVVSVALVEIGCQPELPVESSKPPTPNAEVDSQSLQNWHAVVERVRQNHLSSIESESLLGDQEVSALTGLTSLKELKLPKANVSDVAVAAVASLTSLEVLILGDTTISDRGLAQLGALHALRTLNLNQSRVSDRGLAMLSGLVHLELLRLGTSDITDKGLVSLGRMPSLRYLILQNAHITGRGFKHIYALKNLESLYLKGNPLSGEGVEDLRHALPGLHPDW